MPLRFHRVFRCFTIVGMLLGILQGLRAAPFLLSTNLQLRLILNTTNSSGEHSVRIAKDPRNNRLYYLKLNGDIYQVTVLPGNGSTSSRVYTAADHGLAESVEGMAIGPDGTIYLVGNTVTNSGNSTFARIVKGVPNGSGGRTWSLLAQTAPYPRSQSAFDHLFNGIIVSPDGNYVYVNSGSRTDHGEVQSDGGAFPNTRDVALTAKIFRLPTAGSNLLLPNDLNALRTAGYIFAEGTRNSFDFGFTHDGELFATENGPDRDMSDELNWLRAGLHYGFPWRMGGADNPQQFANYDPANDRLLDPRYIGVQAGYYHNDPTFPASPGGFAEPVVNLGPDADRYRDPADGTIKDASTLGQTLSSVTAHRSPLGLVFDQGGAMAAPFQYHGFMLGFTIGDATGTNAAGPFFDAGQDLVDLDLTRLGTTNYQAHVTTIVGGFASPIDAEIEGNRIYVIEYGGDQAIWEITFPRAAASIVLSAAHWRPEGAFAFSASGMIAGLSYEILASSNLQNWQAFSNWLATGPQSNFVDTTASNAPHRFYRIFQQP
jgi:hypothetical protein